MGKSILIPFLFIILSFTPTESDEELPFIYSNQFNIAGGNRYSMALTSDRTVRSWGSPPEGLNLYGGSGGGVVSIARGYGHALALNADGTVSGFGGGEGNPIRDIPPDLVNVVLIAGGAGHYLALKSDGTVVSWGKDDTGQATVPSDLRKDIVAMAAGDNHSTVVFSDGTCRSWGNSGNCDGITDIRPVPEAIALGRGFNIAIKTDGTVLGWPGDEGPYGALDIPAGLSDVVAVAAGNYHSLALKSDGTVVAWGLNNWGQTEVPDGLDNVVAIAGGMKGHHSLALKSDGTVVGWGRNDIGQTDVPDDLDAMVYEGNSIDEVKNRVRGFTVSTGGVIEGFVWWNDISSLGLEPVEDYTNSWAIGKDGRQITVGTLGVNTWDGFETGIGAIDHGNYKANLYGNLHSDPPVEYPIHEGEYIVKIEQWRSTESHETLWRRIDITLNTSRIIRIIHPKDDFTGLPDYVHGRGWQEDNSYLADVFEASPNYKIIGIEVIPDDGKEDPWARRYITDIIEASLSDVDGMPTVTTTENQFPRRLSYSLSFDGVDDYIELGLWEGSAPSSNATYELWFKANDISSHQILMEMHGYYNGWLYIVDNNLYVHQDNYSDVLYTRIEENTWHHVAITYEDSDGSTKIRLWVDGNSVGEPFFHSSNTNWEADFWIGSCHSQSADGGCNYEGRSPGRFNGNISSVKISSRILYESESDFVWNRDIVRTNNFLEIDDSTFLLWPLNDGIGSTASDISGNSRNGTIYGNAAWSEVNDQNHIAAGAQHSLAILIDGSIAAWGNNSDGQTDVPNGLTGIVEVAAGYLYSLALKRDGTVIGWGSNGFGQLNYPDNLRNVIAIAAGPNHALALTSDRTVTAWGWDNQNQSSVPRNLNDVVAIAAGDFHSLALHSDGTVTGWGSSENTPPDNLRNVIKIAAGNNHSLTLHSDGTVTAWGSGWQMREGYDYGQTLVPAGLSDVVEISAGWWSSYAIHSDGTVTAWGGYSGNPEGHREADDLEDVVAITAGSYDMGLALHSNGSITDVSGGSTVPGDLVALVFDGQAFDDSPPNGRNEMFYMTEDDPKLGIALYGSDPDGDALTYALGSQPEHGTASLDGNIVTYAPYADYYGSDSFRYTVSDGRRAAHATISIEVTAVNDPPISRAQSVTIEQDSTAAIILSGSDIEEDVLSYSLVGYPSKGNATLMGAVVTYTPQADYYGSDSFSYVVSDGAVSSSPATVSIQIMQRPLADSQAVTTPEELPKSINLSGTAAPGSVLVYALERNPLHGDAMLVGSVVTYTPELDYNGDDSFTYTVSVGDLTSSPATVSIAVTAVNDAPVATAQSVTVNEDSTQAVTLAGTDSDGDNLIYSLASNPAHGSAILSGNVVTYTPTSNWSGADFFTFSVSDGTAMSSSAAVSITVTNVNDPPTVSDIFVSGDEDQVIFLSLLGEDVDNDAFTYILDMSQAAGSALLTESVVAYTPPLDYVGTDQFTYFARDGQSLSNLGKVTVSLQAIEDAPRVESVFSSGEMGALQMVALVGLDPEGDTLSFVITRQPEHGKAVLTGSVLAYTPDEGFSGEDRLTFIANDGRLLSPEGSVSFTVGSAEEPEPEIGPTVPVEVDPSAPALSIFPSEVDFGQVRLGREKGTSILVINNTSSRIRLLNLVTTHSSIQINKLIRYDSAGNIVAESTTVPNIINLMAQQEVEINITFRPSATGVLDELLTFGTTATDFAAVEIPLRAFVEGSNERAIISSPLNSLDFGEVVLGQIHPLNLPIRNDGNVLLTVFNAVSDNLQVRIAPNNFTIEPSQSKILEVQLIPLPEKPLSGELTFNSDDPNAPNFVVPWSASLVPGAFLSISQILPGDGERLVETETNLQLTFDGPLFQRGRYLGLDISLFPRPLSGELMDQYEVREDGRTVIFPVGLAESTDYRLVIFSASSSQGDRLFDPVEYSFTTGDAFQPRGQLSGSIATDIVDEVEPLGGSVSIFDTENQLVAQEPLAADGSFVVEDLPAGEYQVVTEVDFSDGTTTQIAFDGDGDGATDVIEIVGHAADTAVTTVVVDYVEPDEVPARGDFGRAAFHLDLDDTAGNQKAEALTVANGEEFQVAVYGSELYNITGYVVSVEYDTTALELIRVTQESTSAEGNVLKMGTGLPIFIVSAVEGNKVGFGGALLAPRASQAIVGDGLLAIYRFEALDDYIGQTPIVLSEVVQRSFTQADTLTLDIEVLVQVDEEVPPSDGETGTLPEGPISLDASLAEGDQGDRIAKGGKPGKVYELELNIAGAPELTGWSVVIEIEPDQVRFVDGSFNVGPFISGLMGLSIVEETNFEVGGAVLGTGSNSGAGSLGDISVELLDGFSEQTTLRITEVSYRLAAGGSESFSVSNEFVISSAPALVGDFDGNGKVDFSDFFMFADAFGSSDSTFDLNGDGPVDFSDFFIFADQFGKEEIAKLLALAVDLIGLPQSASLGLNFPNPFNLETTIPYTVGNAGPVSIRIYDVAGQLVRELVNQAHERGEYKAVWNGTNWSGSLVSSSMYLVRLHTEEHVETKKIMLLK